MAYTIVRPITISAAWAVGSLTDVDFLFRGTYAIYKSVANGGFIQSAFGYDIGFFEDLACTVPLDWEIEKWDPITGEIVAWMRLPAVVVATQTVVYAALGDAAIVTSLENPTGIWFNNGFGSGYRGVWHLPETAKKYDDSTMWGFTATPTGSPPSVAGQIDGAVSLDGATQYMAPDGTYLQITGGLTMSAWVYPTSIAAAATLIHRHVNFMNYRMGMRAGGQLYGGANIRDFSAAESSGLLIPNAWNFVQAGYDGGPFINGVNFVVLNGVRTDSPDVYQNGGYTGVGPTYLGCGEDFTLGIGFFPYQFWPGLLDEVRITTTPWTQPRATMQMTNGLGPVFSFDGIIPGPAGCVLGNPAPVTGAAGCAIIS